MNYKELAIDQFKELKELVLNEDRKAVGSDCTQRYDNDIIIEVEGFWESQDYFEYTVWKEGKQIESGTEYL